MRTCGNYSASLFNEVNDADTFANDWKIDMLKYDACKYNMAITSRPRYEAMGRACVSGRFLASTKTCRRRAFSSGSSRRPRSEQAP